MEDEYALLRAEMIEYQIRGRGIKDPRVLYAMGKVPRHLFVPSNMRASAYEDRALPITSEQTVSQPYMVAAMTELLELKGEENVLEIGTGSGYQLAILAEMAKTVVSVERIKELAINAKDLLKKLGYSNVEIFTGDGTAGYAKKAPYDAIVVTAACPQVPPPLIDQLNEGGRMVLPVGERYSQTLTVARKTGGCIHTEYSFGCVFVPLVGKYGWPD